jgi:hypothetical protein
VQQALPLLQPLLELLSMEGDVPYPQVIRALSAIITPLPFEELQSLGLTPMIQQGLQSNLPDLQILALEQVKKMKEVEDDATVLSLMDCLAAEDASVGKEAVEVITRVRHFDFTYKSSFYQHLFNLNSCIWLKHHAHRFKSPDSSI